MASGLFFDPMLLLRASPLITSTCSLWYAWDEQFFLSIFTRPENEFESSALLPSYFNTFFQRGTASVLTVLALTLSSSAANLYTDRSVLSARGSLKWYIAGTILSAAHLLFAPLIVPVIKAIVEDREGENAVPNVKEWLRVNAIRTLTVDLAAWGAFAIAVTRTLRV